MKQKPIKTMHDFVVSLRRLLPRHQINVRKNNTFGPEAYRVLNLATKQYIVVCSAYESYGYNYEESFARRRPYKYEMLSYIFVTPGVDSVYRIADYLKTTLVTRWWL